MIVFFSGYAANIKGEGILSSWPSPAKRLGKSYLDTR